jgi:polysaccharide biosynthesis protein PslG
VVVRLLTATLAALALAAPAHAARTAPRGFYGAMYDREVRQASADVQARTWGRMAANGVESGRAVFSWNETQAEAGAPLDFSQSDRVVQDAVEHGVQLLPVLTDTPRWAKADPSHWYPQNPADFAAYASALVSRYGRGGSFWADYPQVPERPLRYWQIYNEPGFSTHYGPLLRSAYDAVKQADDGAKVVLAGLFGTEKGGPWDNLRFQYRRGGIGGSFDVAAMHMYTGQPENVAEGVRLFRRVMKRHGDGRKPIWLTEFGITASKGRTTAPRYQRTLRTTDDGMASFLYKAYRELVRRHEKLRLARAYWYTWASSYESGAPIFSFSGLNRYADGRFEAKPALERYRASARRDEGCRKTTTGTCR